MADDVLAEVQAANQAPHDDRSREIMFGNLQFQRRREALNGER
jgi:hypothetical protein